MLSAADFERMIRRGYPNIFIKARGRSASGGSQLSPGGLTAGPVTGVSNVELNQQDTKSGRIARADVAEICVECINYSEAADKTFECYYKDTAKPLNDVGLSNILKKKTSEEEAAAAATGLERRGSTWKELFTGLRSAEDLAT